MTAGNTGASILENYIKNTEYHKLYLDEENRFFFNLKLKAFISEYLFLSSQNCF